MLVVGYIGGTNQTEIIRAQVGTTFANGGVPVLHATLANTDGVRACTATSCEDAIGILKNAVTTRNTAQQSGNADPAALGTIDCNPGALIRARMCGGATSGTSLTAVANTVADTTGLLLTFAATQATYDDAYAIGATGANAGIRRKLTAVTTTAVPIIAFPFDIAVGDSFYLFTPGPNEDDEVQLTTDFTELNVTADNTSNLTLRVKETSTFGADESGATKNYAICTFSEHFLGGASI